MGSMVLGELTEADLLRLAGWFVERSRLIRVEVVGEEALVLVDADGEGRYVGLTVLRLINGSWTEMGSTEASGTTSFRSGGLLWTVGQVDAAVDVVQVACADGPRRTRVDGAGFWVVAEEREPDGDYPVVVS